MKHQKEVIVWTTISWLTGRGYYDEGETTITIPYHFEKKIEARLAKYTTYVLRPLDYGKRQAIVDNELIPWHGLAGIDCLLCLG